MRVYDCVLYIQVCILYTLRVCLALYMCVCLKNIIDSLRLLPGAFESPTSIIVRKSSCTRYNGTRGGVEIVIQYKAQLSTV